MTETSFIFILLQKLRADNIIYRQKMNEQLVVAIAVKGLAPKYSSIEEEAERNALSSNTPYHL